MKYTFKYRNKLDIIAIQIVVICSHSAINTRFNILYHTRQNEAISRTSLLLPIGCKVFNRCWHLVQVDAQVTMSGFGSDRVCVCVVFNHIEQNQWSHITLKSVNIGLNFWHQILACICDIYSISIWKLITNRQDSIHRYSVAFSELIW